MRWEMSYASGMADIAAVYVVVPYMLGMLVCSLEGGGGYGHCEDEEECYC